MPRKAKRPCSRPGCPELVSSDRFCDEHRKDHKRRVDREYDRDRPSPEERGYDWRWRKLRKMVLARKPLCEDPHAIHAREGRLEPATEVHHIVPKKAGGTDHMSNLMACCKSCHSRITAKAGGWGGG